MTTPRILKAILGVVTLSSCLLHVRSETPTIDLTLVAPWGASNLLVEFAETVSTHNETAYFEFIQEFADINQKAASSSWSSHQIYNEALKVVSRLGEDEKKFFELSLAIHEAAPRIQAYNQLYSESVIPLIEDYDDTCEVWVQVGNKQICQLEELSTYVTHAINDNNQHDISIFPFDHVYSPTAEPRSTFVLYTDRFSKTFLEFHDYLLNAVEENKVTYVLRYRPSTEPSKPLYLSGYGVELALKNTDYLVIDDRDSGGDSKDAVKEKGSGFGKKINQHLFESEDSAKIEPLTSAEISNIGLKAAQYIARSENPLLTMEQLSQDFPKYAKRISKVHVDSAFEEEIVENQMGSLQGGISAVWINGKPLEDNQVDPFFLLRTVRSEKKVIQSFQKLGFTAKEANNILSNPSLSKSESEASEAIGEIYDVRDTPEKSFIVWWNDLEKDNRYKMWPSNLMELLKPTYPGQLHTIRKNIYNLLMIEDLSRVNSLSRVILEIRNMVGRNIPIRFGMVGLVDDSDDDDVSTLMSKINYFIIQEYGKAITMKFLTEVLESTKAKDMDYVEVDTIKTAFNNIIKNEKSKMPSTKTFEEALESQNDYAQHVRSFAKRMSIREWNDNQGLIFLNGKFIEFGVESPWIQAVLPSLMEQTRFIQTQLFTGEISDDADIYEYIMNQPHVSNSRNSFIAVSAAHPLRILSFENVQNTGDLKYIQNEECTLPTTNLWVISDLNTLSGLKLVSNALKFIESDNSVRLSLFHSPSSPQDSLLQNVIKEDKEIPFSSLLYSTIYSENSKMEDIQKVIDRALTEESDKSDPKLVDQTKYVAPGSPIIEMMASKEAKGWDRMVKALESDGLELGHTSIVINGRIVGPIPTDVEFSDSDFESLFGYELKSRIEPIQDAIRDTRGTVDGIYLADTIMHITSIIELDKANTPKSAMEDSPPVYRNKVYQKIPGQTHSKLVIGENDDDTFLEIGLIVDPISESAQKMSSIFNVLSGIKGVSISLYLNPTLNLKEMPLKRFYRYVFDDTLHFDNTSGAQETPMAYFSGLPVEPLYTLGVETTNAWHVSVLEANMDLDNILLTSLGSGVSSVYELERILVEGHCLDIDTKGPPRGLQFELGTTGADKTDTIVMANLGYFQLKALPGVWELGLREGRSSDLYRIHNVGTDGAWDWTSSHTAPREKHLLTLTSFEGVTVMPLVKKKPGMESEDVLEGSVHKKDSENGLWSSLSNKLFGKQDEHLDVAKPVQADINIFSVASGKLYERFLSIMMASVMKHTESTVKFWFIENFLSPEFKDFVPYLAKEYGFDYEMVTYKWPSWLRTQKEKQRTIWGYKILFLDVLFPLSLDKVIFVDADQIVRTDLKELVDMDLKGAPYGYTPFCSDRTEMDGFRFWSEGYWKSHLRGRPYHISALYVVDLVRFRQMAAGDRLRSQYQQLSADPNSLANLDQDLPNNMQHVVPIFSLPQEWLWCETWCSDESLKKAKTIDLCNNPLTKEPKLDRARRQVPEWEVYDQAIDGLRKRIKEGTISSEGDDSNSNEKPSHIKDEL
ncbi:glycosyltransferase family 24 protein [Backusella circina FSU 941]|nr:glycosyltransferase family 24 protein [Backusella circina FSU 941]